MTHQIDWDDDGLYVLYGYWQHGQWITLSRWLYWSGD